MPAASNDDSTADQPGRRMSKNPNEAKQHFERKLQRAAARIRQEASGRTCGGCRHWSRQGCEFTAEPLVDTPTPHHPAAVACGHWEARAGGAPSACSPTHPLLPSGYRR